MTTATAERRVCPACNGKGWTIGWVEVHPYQEGCGECNGEGSLTGPIPSETAPAAPKEGTP
jgi:DnaJ-class molecular chaperone